MRSYRFITEPKLSSFKCKIHTFCNNIDIVVPGGV